MTSAIVWSVLCEKPYVLAEPHLVRENRALAGRRMPVLERRHAGHGLVQELHALDLVGAQDACQLRIEHHVDDRQRPAVHLLVLRAGPAHHHRAWRLGVVAGVGLRRGAAHCPCLGLRRRLGRRRVELRRGDCTGARPRNRLGRRGGLGAVLLRVLRRRRVERLFYEDLFSANIELVAFLDIRLAERRIRHQHLAVVHRPQRARRAVRVQDENRVALPRLVLAHLRRAPLAQETRLMRERHEWHRARRIVLRLALQRRLELAPQLVLRRLRRIGGHGVQTHVAPPLDASKHAPVRGAGDGERHCAGASAECAARCRDAAGGARAERRIALVRIFFI